MEAPPRQPPYVPSKEEFTAGMYAYERHEPRGRDYFIALQQLTARWGEASAMADSIWVLLKSWHREFYRFGRLDLSELARCVENHMPVLNGLRGRTIDSLCADDERTIEKLYDPFTTATSRHNKRGVQESAVATAKALHLLAPGFLPLWDNAIAGAHDQILMWAHNYVAFCWQMKELAAAVKGYQPDPDDRSLLKRIDEFNYSVYTKRWITRQGP
jgi:hypothetical protein